MRKGVKKGKTKKGCIYFFKKLNEKGRVKGLAPPF
jgi:hypothetical protein